MADYLVKEVEGKRWLWFKNNNNYLQIEEGVFQVFEQLQKGKSIDEVEIWCENNFQLSEEDAKDAVKEILNFTSEQLQEESDSSDQDIDNDLFIMPSSFFSSKTYRFNGIYFTLAYGDAKIETMFHPLFAHLEVQVDQTEFHDLKLFLCDETYILNLDGKFIGSWEKKEDHVFKGQVFMALLNHAYSKSEKDWLGVLHASAVGDDESSVLFLGDSGNGKSTASAIALASGLSLVADDFVPIDTRGQVLAFPAAISVKKQALEFLSKRFPELSKAKEYELKAMNKTVRYLAPKVITDKPTRKVKALVFIQFTKEVDFELQTMDKHKAFQYLVVDAWLSPEEENARFFLDWIADLPCYRLRYSNNEKMMDAVKGVLSGE
jgi:hypothetical protein